MSFQTTRQLSLDQLACFDSLRDFAESDKQVHIVQGLAGTGKTTVLTEFANEYDMHLVTYTGKAASILREKSGLDASTIHKLIYLPILDSISGKLIGFENIPQNLSGQIIGVDECSMVSEKIARDLLQTGAKILAFGDPGQLPPVEGKPYFCTPDFRLTAIHRQAQDSPIIRQAHAVRNGGLYQADTDNFRVVSGLTDDQLLESDIVLCWTNKTRKAINHRIRTLNGFSGHPKAGESIVCLQNAHKYGLFNGAIYTLNEDFTASGLGKICLDVDGLAIEVPSVAFAKENEIYFDDVKMRVGKKNIISAFDFGNCLTVHKGQGSEWMNVALIDEYRRPEDRIKWLYTGITRAAERMLISRS